MGYSTDFRGSFALDKPLKKEHMAYLKAFADTRRMKRDAAIAETLADPVRKAAGLPIGEEGAYFVGGLGMCGQDRDKSVVDGNGAPSGQPGLWCQWVPSEDDPEFPGIEWDGGEKFYYYVEWLRYLVNHFFEPWGYKLNGQIEWRGEDWDDTGVILVRDNNVSTTGEA